MSDLYPLIPRLLFKRREYWKYCLSGHTCISLSETFSSSPKCTARFFRLVKRLSSDRLRFFLSLKYCIDFFTMLARRIFAGELFCNGNEQGKNAFQSTGFLCYLRSLLLSLSVFLLPSPLAYQM